MDHDPAIVFEITRRRHDGDSNTQYVAIHDQDRLNRWREYFDEMLNGNTTVDEDIIRQTSSYFLWTYWR